MPPPSIDTRSTAFKVGLGGLVVLTLLGLLGGWPVACAFALLYLAVSAGWGILTTRTWWGPVTRRGAALTSAVAVVAFVVVAGATGGDGEPEVPAASSVTDRVTAEPEPAETSQAPQESATPEAPAEKPAPSPTSSPAQRPAAEETADAGTALAAATALTVQGRAASTGYDRDLFGPAWADVDHNGCDTRNDVLRRDLVDVEIRGGTQGCVVETGTFHDPYTGTTTDFERGWDTSILVQVDHVVALADAWQKGAQQWSPATRQVFANDPLNLLASDGDANQAKGAGDTATWLPPNKAFRCEYVARQVAVKTLYELTVTAAEQDAMERVLGTCPDEPLPTGGLVRAGTLKPVTGVGATTTTGGSGSDGAATGSGGSSGSGSGGSSGGGSGGGGTSDASSGGEPGCTVKGNVASDGELIYHVPGGQFYDITNPEDCFDTPADAERAGYRASKL